MPPYQPDTPESGTLEPAQETPPAVGSPWERMRRFTTARIGLGRTGGSQPTQALLDFRLSHARARDAVHSIFDAAALTSSLGQSGVEARILHSAASSRGQYLLRPDLGRRLDEPSEATLREWAASWGVRRHRHGVVETNQVRRDQRVVMRQRRGTLECPPVLSTVSV